MWADVERVTNAIVRSGAGGAKGLDFNGKLPRTPLLMAISGNNATPIPEVTICTSVRRLVASIPSTLATSVAWQA